MTTTSKAWHDFCDQLRDAGASLVAEGAPQDDFSQAEGMRSLIRMLRYATINSIENSDPMYPSISECLDPNMKCKIGGDNPDNIYMRMNVSGKYRYRVSGTRGTVPLMTFGSKVHKFDSDGTLASTGELHSDDIPVDENGHFSFIVSKEKPAEGAWLPMEDDTTNIVGRQSFQDRANEVRADVKIELLDQQPTPAPLDPAVFIEQLRTATATVKGISSLFSGWARRFSERPNEMPDWGQDYFQTTGGDPTIFYGQAYWRLAPDEAWVLETEVPDCEYWNFVLQNYWMESLDHDRMNTYINNHTAKLNDDGTLTIVVAAEDPGFGNWLTTASHEEGTAMLRWVKADHHPLPKCKVVKLSDL
ncbi:DUF1214 domain-containing protein [Nocardioides sp. JQ2195]|uniref:DUF1214 domain-containing protein n=1 Tax=Nocardioides sp. JQ2195 TaxID=2592334 RepID=UPI00143E4445|nr:DUF1214 domain-containing protein [Nocardioides sp. JQ2195]QIX26508.1 DUF1214 domain-containing protein [Nocardioides sp. JQ2195]